jgi:hypothetical protein
MATKTPTKPAAKAAAKSTPSTSTAVAKRPSGNIVSIKEQLQKQAAAMEERVAPATGISVSIKNKEFRFPDGRKTSDPIQVVIVDFVAANSFYEGKYDANNITPPACFAIGVNPMKLVPSDNSPNKQSDSCGGCPMNEFGSDGAGKACKNQRVLALLPPDGDEDAPLWKLTVPPTSTKAWDAYVRSVSSMFQMPPVSVVTTISFDEASDYPKLIFGEPTPNEQLEAHFARQAEAQKLLATEPDVSSYEDSARKPAKKVANARGARR